MPSLYLEKKITRPYKSSAQLWLISWGKYLIISRCRFKDCGWTQSKSIFPKLPSLYLGHVWLLARKKAQSISFLEVFMNIINWSIRTILWSR